MFTITVKGMNDQVLKTVKKQAPTRKYINNLHDRESNKYGAYVTISIVNDKGEPVSKFNLN